MKTTKTTKATKKRKDPRAVPEVGSPMGDAIAALAASLTVTSRLYDWTRDEILLLAAMLPEIRRIIKTLPAGELAKLVGGPAVNIKVKGEILKA